MKRKTKSGRGLPKPAATIDGLRGAQPPVRKEGVIANAPPLVRLWADPGCPWCWQTARWLRHLRDRGLFTIDWKLFSLEVNASDLDADFWDEIRQFSEAHVALMLARREGGNPAFEALYVALGHHLHDQKQGMSPELLTEAISDAGQGDLLEHALADPRLAHEVIGEHQAARAQSVFGVPTLALDDSKVLYGPIIPVAPTDDEALDWWSHVRWLLERPDFFELKRWPRDIKPGSERMTPP